MDGVADELLVLAASQLKGTGRRQFLGEVCLKLCDGNSRQAEYRFGWGRDTVAQGLLELELDPADTAALKSNNRGMKRSEDQNPQLAIDIRLIVEPHTHSDPELKTDRLYMKTWWTSVRSRCRGIRRLVIYLDNGPKNSGVTQKFLRRMVEFADWSGLELRLVYYPPYHSKYNPIERCWSSLQRKWNGVLLTCWEVVRACALRTPWKGDHPEVHHLEETYTDETPVSKREMQHINSRLERSASLPKYDITIKPKVLRGR